MTSNQNWSAYRVEAWPTTFLLDKQGRIRWTYEGEAGNDEAERLIQRRPAEEESKSADKSDGRR